MKSIRAKQFIDALADHLVSAADVDAPTVCSHELVDISGADAVTVVSPFAGGMPDASPEVTLGVQIKSRAATAAASLERSELMLAVFRDARGLSVLQFELPASGDRPAFVVLSIEDLTPPTSLGKSPVDQKYESVLNCFATYVVKPNTP